MDAAAQPQNATKPTKFDNPKKLGFLRIIQIFFMVNILATFVTLVFVSRDDIVYDASTIIDFMNIMFEGVALWMIFHRMKALRPFGIAFPLFNIFVGAGVDLAIGQFSLEGQIFSSLFDITLVMYFFFSQRVKTQFTNPLNSKEARESDAGVNDKLSTRAYIRNLIIYFCVFSVLGHWMEAAMCQLIRLGLVDGEYDPTNTMLWRDWFYPFPMEGLAVVFIVIMLVPFKNWLVRKIKVPIVPYLISFVANALTCAVIEFVMGLFVNANLQLWDYTDMPFNIMGQVCVQNTLAFGVAASLIAWFVYPVLARFMNRIPRDVLNIAFVVILAGYGILQCLYLISPPNMGGLEQSVGSGYTSNTAGSDSSSDSSSAADAPSDAAASSTGSSSGSTATANGASSSAQASSAGASHGPTVSITNTDADNRPEGISVSTSGGSSSGSQNAA